MKSLKGKIVFIKANLHINFIIGTTTSKKVIIDPLIT